MEKQLKLMKVLFLIMTGLLISFPGKSQETAMDFTQAECSGNSHHLFSELDAGKVVILDFVMLNCAPCIVGTNALEEIAADYESSHPGRVHVYSFGFLNSYTCEQLTAWKESNGFTHPVFNNGEEQVDYYGGMGMPTIVVLGTNEHKVFYKSIGYLPSMDKDIKAAIDSALLYNPTGTKEIEASRYKVYPTAFSNAIMVEADPRLAGSTLSLCDPFGRELVTTTLPPGGKTALSVPDLPKGFYFLRIIGAEGVSEGILLVRQ
jgi:thiol-disulfide isomerase/thioredoxin